MGFDNVCFTVYLKKNEKATHRTRGAAVNRKLPKGSPMLLPKFSSTSGISVTSNKSGMSGTTVDAGSNRDLDVKKSSIMEGTMMNFHSGGRSSSVCSQLFTSFESFNNYMCVTSCQSSEIAKKLYYCSFCMKNCGHSNQKDIYFVGV